MGDRLCVDAFTIALWYSYNTVDANIYPTYYTTSKQGAAMYSDMTMGGPPASMEPEILASIAEVGEMITDLSTELDDSERTVSLEREKVERLLKKLRGLRFQIKAADELSKILIEMKTALQKCTNKKSIYNVIHAIDLFIDKKLETIDMSDFEF